MIAAPISIPSDLIITVGMAILAAFLITLYLAWTVGEFNGFWNKLKRLFGRNP
jgi:hypothetical protein